MSTVAPMTAATYKAINEQYVEMFPGGNQASVLAALEEREALLRRVSVLTDERDRARHEAAEVRRLHRYDDASVGELVRRIREHPKSVAPVVHDGYGLDVFTVPVSEDGFRALLSHLDSLLPKEPEVVTGPSGRSYRVKDGGVETRWSDGTSDYWMKLSPWSAVVAQDAPVVAKLLGGKDE